MNVVQKTAGTNGMTINELIDARLNSSENSGLN